jgi:hypothetical protein
MLARMPVTPTMKALAWALISFFGFVISFAALVWPVSQLEQLLIVPHEAFLGTWIFLWVTVSGTFAVAAARLTLAEWPVLTLSAVALLAAGGLVGGVLLAMTADWTIGRYGYNEAEMVGPAYVLFAPVAALAVSGFGVLIAPRFALWAPTSCVVLGLVLFAAIVVDSLPGLADGLGADSRGLATASAVSGAYVLIVGVASFRRFRHRATLGP